MPIQAFPSFVEMTQSRYGRMLYPVQDQYVGRSFQEYGEFSEGEAALFTHFVKPGAIVMDIGAHTVPLAQMAGTRGVVLAFEPQRILHQILCANLALNSIPNVLPHAMALGEQSGTCLVPSLDYGASFNFGGVSLEGVEDGEMVPVGRVDDFQLDRLDFVKLDVEGYEAKVLMGGTETIARCRPVMYIENDRLEKSAALIRLLFDLGYRLWWHYPPLYNPENIKGQPEDVFQGIGSLNMLAVPQERKPVTGLRPILAPDEAYPTSLDPFCMPSPN